MFKYPLKNIDVALASQTGLSDRKVLDLEFDTPHFEAVGGNLVKTWAQCWFDMCCHAASPLDENSVSQLYDDVLREERLNVALS
jgi:hypothetical protein